MEISIYNLIAKGGDLLSTEDEVLSSEQISDARKLAELISKVPDAKRPAFEAVTLAYMQGMEAGIAYAKDMTRSATATR